VKLVGIGFGISTKRLAFESTVHAQYWFPRVNELFSFRRPKRIPKL